MEQKNDRPVLAVAAALGAIFYFFRFGFGFLDPRRVDWLLGMADTAFNQLAWTFFRYDSWHWPPGTVKTFMAPEGTTIGVTDSLPLLAFPFKLISSLLPETFQYAGLWLLINHILMAVFAIKVTGLLFRPLLPRFLAAGVLVLCPAWLIRDGHFALSAHWVYLAALYLYLKPAAKEGDKPHLRWWLLLAAAALIHPYPATFGLCFMAADQARRLLVTREVSWLSALTLTGAGVGVVVALWYLAGFLRIGHLPVGNLPEDALWSASFHALWDGQGRALIMPALPLGNHEPFEGFVYLGLGGLLAVALALILGRGKFVKTGLTRHWPLAVILVLCAAYAYGPRTDLGDQLYRAQARFLWPHFYVLVGAGLVAVAKWDRPRRPLALLVGLFALQVVDLAPLFDRKSVYDATTFTSRLEDPQWAEAMAETDLLVTLPNSTATTVFENDFVDLTLLAHEYDIPTTSGFATRNYAGSIDAANKLAGDFLFGKNTTPGTVAVVRRSHFAEIFPNYAGYIRCTDLDGFPVCFAIEGGFSPDLEFRYEPVPLAAFLAENLEQTLILVGRGDVSSALTTDTVRLLAGQGSRIAQVPEGSSYACIMVGGQPVFEQMNPQSAIEVTAARGSALGPLKARREISLMSGGRVAGPYASLTVDGREVLFNRTGLNVAVLDQNQNVVAAGTFAHPDDMPYQGAKAGGLVFILVRRGQL